MITEANMSSVKVKLKTDKDRQQILVPTIALRGLVVFPNNVVHFEVGRPRSIAAIEWAMENSTNVFLVAQKDMDVENPTSKDLYAYGVMAEVKQILKVSDDLVKVLVEGKYRAKLEKIQTDANFLQAAIQPAPVRGVRPADAPRAEALVRDVYKRQALHFKFRGISL